MSRRLERLRIRIPQPDRKRSKLRGGRCVAPWLSFAAILVAGWGGTGCASIGGDEFDWSGTRRPETGAALRVLWVEQLMPEQTGPFIPVQKAAPALDPARNRVYIGSTEGVLYAYAADGQKAWRYHVEAPIETAPRLDPDRDELYVADGHGALHALRASDGSRRWKDAAGDAIRQPPVLSEDAVYVVTDSDRVVAFAREDGALLWDYERDIPEGFSISTRAGLLQMDGQLVTGFTDGAVVALDPADGEVVWERDTSLDLDEPTGSQPVFRDVDTTPLLVNDTLYVASFSAGLYALDPRNGSVRWRASELTGVVGLAAEGRRLVLASADHGLHCLELPGHEVRWQVPLERGAPTVPVLHRGLVLVGASEGSMRALELSTGEEVGRIEAGNGFSAPPVAALARGFVLSNGGTFYAFAL